LVYNFTVNAGPARTLTKRTTNTESHQNVCLENSTSTTRKIRAWDTWVDHGRIWCTGSLFQDVQNTTSNPSDVFMTIWNYQDLFQTTLQRREIILSLNGMDILLIGNIGWLTVHRWCADVSKLLRSEEMIISPSNSGANAGVANHRRWSSTETEDRWTVLTSTSNHVNATRTSVSVKLTPTTYTKSTMTNVRNRMNPRESIPSRSGRQSWWSWLFTSKHAKPCRPLFCAHPDSRIFNRIRKFSVREFIETHLRWKIWNPRHHNFFPIYHETSGWIWKNKKQIRLIFVFSLIWHASIVFNFTNSWIFSIFHLRDTPWNFRRMVFRAFELSSYVEDEKKKIIRQ